MDLELLWFPNSHCGCYIALPPSSSWPLARCVCFFSPVFCWWQASSGLYFSWHSVSLLDIHVLGWKLCAHHLLAVQIGADSQNCQALLFSLIKWECGQPCTHGVVVNKWDNARKWPNTGHGTHRHSRNVNSDSSSSSSPISLTIINSWATVLSEVFFRFHGIASSWIYIFRSCGCLIYFEMSGPPKCLLAQLRIFISICIWASRWETKNSTKCSDIKYIVY